MLFVAVGIRDVTACDIERRVGAVKSLMCVKREETLIAGLLLPQSVPGT